MVTYLCNDIKWVRNVYLVESVLPDQCFTWNKTKLIGSVQVDCDINTTL
jgi:hypothetical protein